MTTEQIRAEIAAAGGGGGGGGVGGARYADMWSEARQLTSGSFQARPSSGFDFRTKGSGAPRLGFRTNALSSPWSASDYVTIVCGDTGWFNAVLFYQLRFYSTTPNTWDVGMSYPEQDTYARCHFPIDKPMPGVIHKFAYNFGPIHLTAGDEIFLESSSSSLNDVTATSDLGDNQFCLALTTLNMEESGVWTPPSGDSSYHCDDSDGGF
jgi:hypothetical protein